MLVSRRIYNKNVLKKAQTAQLSSGLGKEKRKIYWTHKCRIREDKRLYEYYCSLPCKYDHDISKDVTRTFTLSHQFCNSTLNYMRLQRVLHSFAVKHPEIGYIQGLNFLVGNLLLLFPEEVLSA